MAQKAEKYNDMVRDYYKLLNVDYTASNMEISQAYKKMLFLFHPDINKSAPRALIRELITAHKVLTDSRERFHYNQELIRNYQKSRKTGWKKIISDISRKIARAF